MITTLIKFNQNVKYKKMNKKAVTELAKRKKNGLLVLQIRTRN